MEMSVKKNFDISGDLQVSQKAVDNLISYFYQCIFTKVKTQTCLIQIKITKYVCTSCLLRDN